MIKTSKHRFRHSNAFVNLKSLGVSADMICRLYVYCFLILASLVYLE